MSWSYTGNPASSSKDAVRYYCGDTNGNTGVQLLTDEEINFTLTEEPNVKLAAANACEAIAAKYGIQADNAVGDLKVQASQRAEAFARKAADLRRKGNRSAVPILTGMNVADKQDNEADTSVVQPTFYRGQEDNPTVGPMPDPNASVYYP